MRFCVRCRLLIGLEYALLVWWTPSVKQEDGFPVYYYAVVLLSYAVHQVSLLVSGLIKAAQLETPSMNLK